ncbi:MAG: VWA domain-containing protein [Pseudomonadota bacterium]
MLPVLTDFIRALRASNVRVSPAETMDAAAAIEVTGFADKALLRDALSQVLAKSPLEKADFEACFERFFTFEESSLDSKEQPATDLDTAPSQAPDTSQTQTPGGGEGDGQSLLEMLNAGDTASLEMAISNAASEVGVSNIRLFTQRGVFTRRILEELGIDAVEDALFGRSEIEDIDLDRLRAARDSLFEDVRNLVDRQLVLYASNAWPELREEILEKVPLARVEQRDFRFMQQLVRKLAKRLVALYSRRRRVARRGQLDVRGTIRKNIEYDGLMFDLVWRRTKVDRPKVIAVCDVSGSVANVARFLLMFLYSITEVIPNVRAFAFSNDIGEVTTLFETKPVEEAINQALFDHGRGSTDYGTALAGLANLTLDDIDHRTTVLILGDARSNYGDPGHAALRKIHERARRVLWLNPEPKSFWNTGDSEMRRLGSACDRVEVCRSIKHLERLVSELLRTAI